MESLLDLGSLIPRSNKDSIDRPLHMLSMESLLDLGMRLPSAAGHNDHEMPPKHGQICGYEGALLTESWPVPAASTKIKS